MIETSVRVEIDIDSKIKKLGGDELGNFAATTAHRHFYDAMPYDTGAFADSIDYRPWEYEHLVPYANRVYNHNYNFRKDYHPMAMSNYVEGYGVVANPKIAADIQAYIDSRKLGLNE